VAKQKVIMARVTFQLPNGLELQVEAPLGLTLLQLAKQNDIPMLGTCGGSCVCSTCHVIVRPEDFERVGEPQGAEAETLEFADGTTPTSRLGCQIKMTESLDGLTIRLANEG
jgi:ferredoxin